jgi:hypothetical protein
MAEVVEKINRDDIIQQYQHNIVYYKGKPVFVINVSANGDNVTVLDLKSQEQITVPFNLNDFKAPISRLGMMNYNDTVVYLSRLPLRRMNIGINQENLRVDVLPFEYKRRMVYLIDEIKQLTHSAFVSVFEGKYPSLKDAIAIAERNEQACAFDRQFAVGSDKEIYYKTNKVGSIRGDKVSDIVWKAEYPYLSILLEGNHEKAIGIPCSKSN